jgi:hypothetical protein
MGVGVDLSAALYVQKFSVFTQLLLLCFFIPRPSKNVQEEEETEEEVKEEEEETEEK